MGAIRTEKESCDTQALFARIYEILEADPRFCGVMLSLVLKADEPERFLTETLTGYSDKYSGDENKDVRGQMSRHMGRGFIDSIMQDPDAGFAPLSAADLTNSSATLLN
jgi:hypothetical protein